jgi:diaminohydroxyphosphoribosylaminopyrimidine deaminase/5-amino-6-(5-phosphoribosylamino)uracil reductase
LCGALLKEGLVDEILMYQAPVLLGEGGPGLFDLGILESMNDRTQLEVVESCQMGVDVRLRIRPRHRSDETQAGGK